MKKRWVALLVFTSFFLGGLIFSNPPKEKIVIAENGNATLWRDLKRVDDEGFRTAAEIIDACSGESTDNLSDDDIATLIAKVKDFGKKRQAILRELGY